MSAIDRVKELLAAVETECVGRPHDFSRCPHCCSLSQVNALAILFVQALVDSQEALAEIGHGENTSYLACPGPPHCDKSHYPTCPVQIARDALRLGGLAKVMKQEPPRS